MDNSLRESILRRDHNCCKACGRRSRCQVKHILSPRLGGSDSPTNLVALCHRCQMLISPIAVDYLLEFFGITENELLRQKAKVEIAIYSWITNTIDEASSTGRSSSSRNQRRSSARKPRLPREIPEWKRGRPRAGKRWTREEDELLLQSFDAGLAVKEISAILGRGEFSIEVRLGKLGRADLLPERNV